MAILSSSIILIQSNAQSNLPPYAQPGAFVSYTSIGGFIPFFGGVSGDATYTITQVLANGSMQVILNETISQGGLGSSTNTSTLKYYFDDAFSPSFFPAVPPSLLGSSRLTVQGIECNLTGRFSITVPAGTFSTYEYTGKDVGGNLVYFWLDSQSGVVVEMSSGVSAMQMTDSNVAFPSSVSGPAQSELPYVVVVLISWGAMGLLFLYIRRHFSSKKEVWTKGSPRRIAGLDRPRV